MHSAHQSVNMVVVARHLPLRSLSQIAESPPCVEEGRRAFLDLIAILSDQDVCAPWSCAPRSRAGGLATSSHAKL